MPGCPTCLLEDHGHLSSTRTLLLQPGSPVQVQIRTEQHASGRHFARPTSPRTVGRAATAEFGLGGGGGAILQIQMLCPLLRIWDICCSMRALGPLLRHCEACYTNAARHMVARRHASSRSRVEVAREEHAENVRWSKLPEARGVLEQPLFDDEDGATVDADALDSLDTYLQVFLSVLGAVGQPSSLIKTICSDVQMQEERGRTSLTCLLSPPLSPAGMYICCILLGLFPRPAPLLVVLLILPHPIPRRCCCVVDSTPSSFPCTMIIDTGSTVASPGRRPC